MTGGLRSHASRELGIRLHVVISSKLDIRRFRDIKGSRLEVGRLDTGGGWLHRVSVGASTITTVMLLKTPKRGAFA